MAESKYVIAYDFGTGGTKASLYDAQGRCLADHFASYETHYPRAGWHEQRPEDWWASVVESTRQLLAEVEIDPNDIEAIGISGHSLGVVPLDAEGRLLRQDTPIWSDSRPDTQPAEFFAKVSESQWYMTTGNGFPPPLYTVFKIMWLRDNEPELFARIDKVIGTKDYINFRMTGAIATDYSYASGSGVYDLVGWKYSDQLIAASGLSPDIFPRIVPSTEVLGTLTPQAAEELSLPQSVKVVAGGVDNSCMALGARAHKEGDCYNSMGSSSWIAVTSAKPLLDEETRPYVFTHVVPEKFTSALGVFSTGSSFRWVREQLCTNLDAAAQTEGVSTYDLMLRLAADSDIGAGATMFLPTMAGGSSLDASQHVRGAFVNLDLGDSQGDLIRATMEGVAMSLQLALEALERITDLSSEMIAVGGGSRSDLWMQIYADLYNKDMIRTNIGQQAAALGAAAVALVGVGLWDDFSRIEDIHEVQDVRKPISANQTRYALLTPIFKQLSRNQAEIGDMFASIGQET
ncbi:MAG: FGGY-family carbohydrate kinase [Phycisphaerae bacterium]|jgi:xylulokinase|nr:FGGY-family carbohydrate kinase [Phycisphaerae bacterium]